MQNGAKRMKILKKFSAKNKKNIIFSFGILLFFTSVVLSICIGSSAISLKQLINCVISSNNTGIEKSILMYVRLPRTLACIFAGAGLSVSGAILQRVLANKLASPSIIGVNAGAGLGITICSAIGAVSAITYSISAFLGSVLAVTVITLAAYRTRAAKTTVILGGVAINAILNACSEAITVLNNDAAIMSVDFRVGGFSSVSYVKIIPAIIMILIALIITSTILNELDVLSMGDETSQGLGMNVRRTKNTFLFLASLLAGASVSFAGLLGFIGLIIPHFVRKVCGTDSKTLIFGSCIFGATFLTLSDVISRVIFAPYELPVGIIMAIIGGPVFVMLLIRKKGGHSND